MKRIVPILAFAVLLTFAGIALAGDGEHCDSSKAHAAKSHSTAAKAKVAQWAKSGWLGVETEKADTGYRITAVHASSPAEEAGFQAGDVLVALNGVRLSADNKAAVKAEKKSLRPGSKVAYTVVRNGSKQQLAAVLAPVPEAVLAEWYAEAESQVSAETQIAEND